MAIKFRLCFLLAMCTLALSISNVFAVDLPSVRHESLQVKPLIAVTSPGEIISLDVHCEGVKGVGTNNPIVVTGTPEGTRIEIITISEQQALINLIFPTTVGISVWAISVQVGNPTPLLEQIVHIVLGA